MNLLRVLAISALWSAVAPLVAQQPQRHPKPKPPSSTRPKPAPKPAKQPQSDPAKGGRTEDRGPSILDLLAGKSDTPIIPPRAQPLRPGLDLDLHDRTACIAALASLASLPYQIDSKKHRGAVGLDPDAESWTLLDESARLFALQSADDAEVRDIARLLQEIWIENWRVHAANEVYGGSQDWSARSLWQRVATVGTYVAGKDLATTTRDRKEMVCTGPDGRPMVTLVLSDEPSELEHMIDAAFASAQESNGSEHDRRRAISQDLDAVRGLAHERLLRLWKERLEPLAHAAAGPITDTAPVRVLSTFDVESTRAQGWGASALVVTTAGNEAITDVTIRVDCRSGLGEAMNWFGHLARLEPGQQWLLYPAGLWWGALLTTGQIEGTVSVWSTQGSFPSIAVAAGNGMGAGNKYVHDQRLRDIQEHLPAAPRTQAALSRLGPPARDPVAARADLLQALGKGVTLEGYAKQRDGDLIMTANAPCRLTVDELDVASGAITISLTMWALGDKPVPVQGRIEEEVARGCVLALHLSPILEERALAARRARVSVSNHAAFDASAAKERAQWARDADRWRSREIWLATDLFDIVALQVARENPMAGALYDLASGRPIPDLRRVERLQRTVPAELVVFADSNGQLFAQMLNEDVCLLAGMRGPVSLMQLDKVASTTTGQAK